MRPTARPTLRRWLGRGQPPPGAGAAPDAQRRRPGPQPPTQRPGAGGRNLTTVPGADLPPPSRHAKAEPDTLERIWAVSDQEVARRSAGPRRRLRPTRPALAEVTTPEWGDAPPPPAADDRGLTIERPQPPVGRAGRRPATPDPPSSPRAAGGAKSPSSSASPRVALTATATLASRDDNPREWPVSHPCCHRAAPGPGTGCRHRRDSCPDALTVDGAVVQPAPSDVGEPGDQVALGDWDCDGSASAALRPPTGDVFVFLWAESGAPQSA
jgi:hypothetical protein